MGLFDELPNIKHLLSDEEMMKLLDNVSADDLVDFLEKEGVTNNE